LKALSIAMELPMRIIDESIKGFKTIQDESNDKSIKKEEFKQAG